MQGYLNYFINIRSKNSGQLAKDSRSEITSKYFLLFIKFYYHFWHVCINLPLHKYLNVLCDREWIKVKKIDRELQLNFKFSSFLSNNDELMWPGLQSFLTGQVPKEQCAQMPLWTEGPTQDPRVWVRTCIVKNGGWGLRVNCRAPHINGFLLLINLQTPQLLRPVLWRPLHGAGHWLAHLLCIQTPQAVITKEEMEDLNISALSGTFISSVQSLSHVQLFGTPWTVHFRLPCPSPTPWACSNSCPLSRWYHPTISSFVITFSFWPQSFPASGSFPVSHIRWPQYWSFNFSISPSRTDFL